MKNPLLVTCALLFVSVSGSSQTMAGSPEIDLAKAQCIATAACESGSVQCTGRQSSTNCLAVDFNCGGERGRVTCDGVTTLCPKPGEVCHLEQRPAATLLVPYFEVDAKEGGRDTILAVANAFDTPVLVKAEVWTDLGVGLFGFNIYLAGHDVQTFALSTVLRNGILPQTQPPAGALTSCKGVLPPHQLSQSEYEDYQAALQGLPFGGQCGGLYHHDTIMRGYMTFDTVSICSTMYPGSQSYFLSGIPTDQNALWGDYIYVNFPVPATSTTNLVTAGLPMVHIRASCVDSATTTLGRYTFYGALIFGAPWTAADNRQPLATQFQVRFLNDPSLANSDVIVWRDPKVRSSTFLCDSKPSWYPLGQEGLAVFDEDGTPYALGADVKPFPAVAQRISVGPAGLAVPVAFGWLSLDLNGTVAAGNPPADPTAQQAWVTVLHASGTTGALMNAVWLDTACEALHKR